MSAQVEIGSVMVVTSNRLTGLSYRNRQRDVQDTRFAIQSETNLRIAGEIA